VDRSRNPGRGARRAIGPVLAALVAACAPASCSSSDAGGGGSAPDAGGGSSDGGGATTDGGGAALSDGASDGAPAQPADHFATRVVSFTKGECGGFGSEDQVLGPPDGGGDENGSLDVLSLGDGGVIVLSFEPNAIVDGPGPDFIVFENAFLQEAGDPASVYAEVGEVSVSDDGATWTTYPCTATAYPYGACAGWHPTYSAPGNGVSPADPATAGGDAFDLATVGVARARYVRIRDASGEACTSQNVTKNGFDLDAVAIVHGEAP